MHPKLKSCTRILAISFERKNTRIETASFLLDTTEYSKSKSHRFRSTFSQIREQCLQSGQLFEDPEFPATDASVFYSQPRQFVWKRPSVSSICFQFPFCVLGGEHSSELDTFCSVITGGDAARIFEVSGSEVRFHNLARILQGFQELFFVRSLGATSKLSKQPVLVFLA